jgi:NADP-dependent 3-hydroxy acid dehydrogenase YdfG
MNLTRANVLLTGASSGIGRATAVALGKASARVALLARRRDRLQEVAEEIRVAGGEALPVPTDVTNANQMHSAVTAARSRLGELDAAVLAAGIGVFKPFPQLTHAEWQQQIDVLLTGVYLSVRSVLPNMLERGRGHIVVVSSRFAREGSEQSTAYCAAKFGVRGFLDSLRHEVRHKGIKVSNIMPGTVQTELFDEDWEVDFSKVLQPLDVAETVLDVLRKPGRCVVEEVVVQSLEHPY